MTGLTGLKTARADWTEWLIIGMGRVTFALDLHQICIASKTLHVQYTLQNFFNLKLDRTDYDVTYLYDRVL